MTNDKTLPPLPASDEKSFAQNAYNPFYQRRTKEFWGDSEIVREKVEPFKKCKHSFVPEPGGAKCKKCNFGLMGIFEVQKGKLYYKGKAIGL